MAINNQVPVFNAVREAKKATNANASIIFIPPRFAANAKIDPRIGPIQGVQPNPKAAPTSNGKAKLLLYWSVKILMSLIINCKLKIPINWSEKNIIIIPAMILKILELVKKNFPINEAVEPNAMKTKEKPKAKIIVLTTIKFFFFSTSLSKDVPEI